MKLKKLLPIVTLTGIATSLPLISCSKGEKPVEKTMTIKDEDGNSLPNTIEVDQTIAIAAFDEDNKKIEGVKFSTESTSCITIDGNKITGIGEGDATVVVSAEGYTGTKWDFKVIEPEVKGDIFNIVCFEEPTFPNDVEFVKLFKKYISDEKSEDANPCHLGDVEVKFTIVSPEGGLYENHLDNILPTNEKQAEENRIDMFLAEPDYIYKYVNRSWTNNIENLGIRQSDFNEAYDYAVDVCSDTSGIVKGTCVNLCPSVVFFRKSIARDVLGTDYWPEVGSAVFQTLETFASSYEQFTTKGYFLEASYESSFRTFAGNRLTPWVNSNLELNEIDQKLVDWKDMTKAFLDAGATQKIDQGTDEWMSQFSSVGKSFCEFGPNGLYNQVLQDSDGDWAVCASPETISWGGTWVLLANGGNNDDEARETIKSLNDESILTEICYGENTVVNYDDVNYAKASDADYKNAILDGQNDWQVLYSEANWLSYKNATKYDAALNEDFKNSMKDYFDGTFTTYEEAIEDFKNTVKIQFPEIKVD